MKPLSLYQIDAFTRQTFSGNPAALVPLDHWLEDDRLQAIAAENNLSETAYFVPHSQTDFHLRWFTPRCEIDLCGHATLATAWWLFHHGGWTRPLLHFTTRSGVLIAERAGEAVRISLPARPSHPVSMMPAAVSAGLGRTPAALRSGANLIAIYPAQADIEGLTPDFAALRALHPKGVIVTAPGEDCDFVSRYFAPSFGVDEDPVTGSAHADLAPYWAEILGRDRFKARQLSARGGELDVELAAGRVGLTGHCALYLRGEIFCP